MAHHGLARLTIDTPARTGYVLILSGLALATGGWLAAFTLAGAALIFAGMLACVAGGILTRSLAGFLVGSAFAVSCLFLLGPLLALLLWLAGA